jgi:DNA-binding Xre family transcriptional regulator
LANCTEYLTTTKDIFISQFNIKILEDTKKKELKMAKFQEQKLRNQEIVPLTRAQLSKLSILANKKDKKVRFQTNSNNQKHSTEKHLNNSNKSSPKPNSKADNKNPNSKNGQARSSQKKRINGRKQQNGKQN